MRLTLAVLAVVYALGVCPAAAQTASEGSIRGYVKDEQGAVLPGVTVQAASPDAPGTYAGVSDDTGQFRILNLPPGTFRVTAEVQGFAKYVREGIVMRAGLNLAIEIRLQVGDLSESVEVKSENPLIDNRSAATGVNVAGSLQRALPLSTRRQWADFMFLVPGVVSTEGSAFGGGFYVRGADFGSHAIQVDGADVAAPSQSSFSYAQLGPDALADVQIKTGGIDASAPLGVGAIVNISTYSGTNRLSGSASLSFQDKSWSSNNNPGGTAAALDQLLFDASLGGPIQSDKWWYFGTYRRTRTRTGIARTAEQIATLKSIVPSFEPFDSENDANFLFVKATGRLGPNHQVQGFYQRDRNPVRSGTAVLAGPYLMDIIGGMAAAGRWNAVWSPSLTTRVSASYNDKGYPGDAYRQDVPATYVHAGVFPSGGRLTSTGLVALLDNNGMNYLQPHDKLTLTADATYFKSGWLGTHELQTGVYLQPKLHIVFGNEYVNNGFWQEERVLIDPANPGAGSIPFHRQIYTTPLVYSTDNNGEDYAVYVQDSWKPSERLTVNAGVRIDWVRRYDNLFDVRVQDTTAIGPRFGATYLLTDDGRNVVRGAWTRVHDSPSVTSSTSAGTNTAEYRDLYDMDLNGSFETEFVTPAQTQAVRNRIIDLDGFGQPYIEEWTLGYKRQLPGQVALDAGIVRRDYRGRLTQIETNAIYDGQVFKGYRDEAFNEIYLFTSNSWNWQTYTDFTVQATKQTSRMQAIASYTRQWRHMSGTWQPNDPASFIQPGAFANELGIGSVRGTTRDGNSLSGTHMTDGSQWRDHQVRLAGSIALPWQIMAATTYVYQSGPWSGPIVTRVTPDPAFGPATVTLSNGRVVSNPLATPIRFVGQTRNDDQFRLSGFHVWNVRLGRQMALGDRRTLDASVDFINLTNHDADQGYLSGANQTYSPNYGLGTSRQAPRAAQVSVRLVF